MAEAGTNCARFGPLMDLERMIMLFAFDVNALVELT